MVSNNMGKGRRTSVVVGGIILVAAPVVLLVFLVLGIAPIVRVPVTMPVVRVPVVKPPVPKVPIVVPEPSVKQAGSLVFATRNIRDAMEAVQEERARTRDERDAMDAFLHQVTRTEASQEMGRVAKRSRVFLW